MITIYLASWLKFNCNGLLLPTDNKQTKKEIKQRWRSIVSNRGPFPHPEGENFGSHTLPPIFWRPIFRRKILRCWKNLDWVLNYLRWRGKLVHTWPTRRPWYIKQVYKCIGSPLPIDYMNFAMKNIFAASSCVPCLGDNLLPLLAKIPRSFSS